jgi:hypothetical protein
VNCTRFLNWLSLSIVAISTQAMAAAPQDTVSTGLDHIPVAVRDLEQAVATYRSLGFAIKPGRDHANRIRNAHVKFPTGAGIELLTAPVKADPLSSSYVDFLLAGEGPTYVSFHARDTERLHAGLRAGGFDFREQGGLTDLVSEDLGFLFWVRDNRSSTDRPEHFDHANGATALRAVWIATEEAGALTELLVVLGGVEERRQVFAPGAVEATVIALDQGEVIILPRSYQTLPGRPVVGASFSVRDLQDVRRAISEAGIQPWTGEDPRERIVIEPQKAHGLWLEFEAGS